MTLADILCPPIPEEWKKEPYAIVDEDGIVIKPKVKVEKTLSEKETEKLLRDAYRGRYDDIYNKRRREKRAALKELLASTRLSKNQDEMRANAVKAMIDESLNSL